MDRDVKVSTVTSSPDLLLRGQRSKKVKTRTISNGKNNSVYVFNMDRDAKVFMVTSLSDLPLSGRRSKVTAGLFVFYGALVLTPFWCLYMTVVSVRPITILFLNHSVNILNIPIPGSNITMNNNLI